LATAWTPREAAATCETKGHQDGASGFEPCELTLGVSVDVEALGKRLRRDAAAMMSALNKVVGSPQLVRLPSSWLTRDKDFENPGSAEITPRHS
jgi:hypothetical protein